MASVDLIGFRAISHDRRSFLKSAAASIAAGQFGGIGPDSSDSIISDGMPSLRGATDWLNSKPLTKSDLHGKVVLVDFWTYSCINWRRTLPYLCGWAKKYKDHGLILIGVHTPEFEFEKDTDNVRQAVKAVNIDYPVAMDNNYAIWQAFHNAYWPAIYFVDANAQVRAHKFGEGDYDQSERTIRQLLRQAGAAPIDGGLLSVDAAGAEVAADWANLQSPETYAGYERTQNLASPGGLKARKSSEYSFPPRLKLNHWALSGSWTAEKQSVVSSAAQGRVAYQFHARDVHLVMGPATPGASVRFRVLMDGQAPGNAHGIDTDEQGKGVIAEPRMYQLVRQSRPIADRRVEIEFIDPGANVFSFTFG